MAAPTYLRGQVERVATTCAMLMKYSSHDARGRGASGWLMRGSVACPPVYSAALMSGKDPKDAKPEGKTKGKYADTVMLPDTRFPMKADLAQREPAFIDRWIESN